MVLDSQLKRIDVCGFPVGIETYAPSELSESLATVIMLHGRDGPDGIAGDRSYRDIAQCIASAGFRVVLPRYFERTRPLEIMAPESEMEAIGREIEHYGLWLEAIGEVVQVEVARKCPVGLLGYSLGGYLALTAAMAWRGVAAVVTCYAGVPTPFIGLAANLPPTLILHGSKDQVVPVDEASNLSRLLLRNRIEHSLHVYPESAHGFCGPEAADAVARVIGFLQRYLSPRE